MTNEILNIAHEFDITWGAVILYLLAGAGYAKIFQKCGARKIWAFIPAFREYWIGKCADKEEEGRITAIAQVAVYLFGFGYRQAIRQGDQEALLALLLAIMLVASIVTLIYSIRLYSGLCSLFGKKKIWILPLMILQTEWIVTITWGFGKAQPKFHIGDKEKLAAPLSGIDVEKEGKGLTVNITERAVTQNFGKKVLLKDIHMSVRPGHMVLLLGGSGCGKTTFINAVTGYEKANASIHVNGQDLYKNYKNLQHEIGMVPQQNLMRFSDLVGKTVEDAAATRLPVSVKGHERRKRVEQVLETVGLTQSKNNLVGKLSGGQLRRLSIAMELISDPNLFVLDEPDSGLDGIMARGLMQDLRKIADTGKIVMVITHTPDRVVDLFDDVIILAKDATNVGRLSFFGSISDARKFFDCETMEGILRKINQKGDGGEGLADEYITKYTESLKANNGIMKEADHVENNE